MSLLWRRRSELHPDQIRAIDGLPANGRYLLMGPPGSGKTSILLHRGQYLRMAPNLLSNIRLITFGRTLREFIALNGDDRFPPALIQTMREFVNDLYKSYKTVAPEPDSSLSLTEKNRQRAVGILSLIKNHGKKVNYEALLVDEIQDLSAEEIKLFAQLTQRLMLAGDSRQKLYEAEGAAEEAKKIGCTEITLQHHFRISPQICQVADAILMPGDYSLSQYCHYQGPTPTTPIARGNLSRSSQIKLLVDQLDLQLDTYNNADDLIGVVAWKKEDCDTIHEALEDIPKFQGLSRVFHSGIERRTFDGTCRICIVTIPSSKGLEFRALHWLFADENYRITREAAYTVVTRAKSSLTVYHNGNLPALLAGAFSPASGGLFEDDE